MSKPHSVSFSETSTYLSCKRRWEYSYGRSLRAKDTPAALAFGSAGHKVLEAYYASILSGMSHDDALEEAGAAMAELEFTQPANRANLIELFDTYFVNEPFVSQGYEVLAVEKEFALDSELPSGEVVRTPFVIDLIVRTPGGSIAVVDHKFLYDFLTHEESELQPQIPLYIACLRALNYQVSHGIYNQLRTRKLKDGIDSDTHLRTMEMRPSATRVGRVFLEQIDTASEIIAAGALSEAERDIKMHRVNSKMICRNCDFYTLCTTELRGGNVPLLLKTNYDTRARRSFEETEVREEIGH